MPVSCVHTKPCLWARLCVLLFSLCFVIEAAAQTSGDINAAGRQADQMQRAQEEQRRQAQPDQARSFGRSRSAL
ncbi:MAG: hypothetical protein HRT83_00150 [Hyphomicrobiaceae bacterium]|nr:hypothetical protein [Hyphomicrobiaceae bacterium]